MAARRVLQTTGVAAALAGALSSDTSCFQEGKEYRDGALTESLPNGAFVHEPYQCQLSCQRQADSLPCRGFTWRAAPAAPTLLRGATGPGGCWLVTDSAVLTNSNLSLTPGRVVSGPADCGLVTTTTLRFTTAPAPVAAVGSVSDTMAPLSTAAPLLKASEADLTTTMIVLGETNTTGNVTAAGAPSTGFTLGSPWTIFRNIMEILGAIALAVCVYYGCKDKCKKKKEQRRKEKEAKANLKEYGKKNKTTRGAEVDSEDEQVRESGSPLLVPNSPPPPSPGPSSKACPQQTMAPQAGEHFQPQLLPQAFPQALQQAPPPFGQQTVLNPYGYAQPQLQHLQQQMVYAPGATGHYTGQPAQGVNGPRSFRA